MAQRAQLCAETVGKELVAHAPIFVEGNQNFTYENGVTSGSGTATDPYIIENWKINATTANGIEIRNTNAFFVIRNCEIYGKPYFSIYLCNVTHGNIENITSYGHVRGVELFCSSEIAIANSTLYDNYYYGIICSYSYNITISNLVTRNNSYWGIYLHTCSNINLENSTAQGNSYGIIMKLCANIKIANCKVNSNTQQGVCIEDCIQTILKNNTLENNKYNLGVKGKELAHYYHEIAASNTVDTKPVYYIIEQSNLVFNTTTVGYLALISCNNTRVENLTIAKNIQALLLTNTSFSTVANCSFYESYCGVELQSSSDSSIKNCSVYNNSMYGIYLGKSSHALIANCSLWDNYISVGFDSSSDSSIKGSLIYESFTGISLWGSSNNSITSNRIYNNTHGAKVTASTQLIFRNNSFENNKFSFGVSGWNIQDYYHDIDISNTINSKPIHYIIENNNTTFNESLQIGYLAIISSSYCSVENTTFSSNLQGLLLANSSFSTVSNCSFQSNLEALSIWRSSALTILNSTFYNNSNVGVSVIESSELNIINSQFDVNGAGTRIESSRNITVADSIFSNNSIGSALLESSLSNFENCSFYNNANSLLLTSSTNNLFINCSSHSNSENAFSFMSSSKNTIASCNAINSKEGFSFKQSFNNNIAWCSAYNNKKGFKFEQSSNNNISSCVAYSNQYGFLVEASLNNKFTNCKSYLNFNGIVFKLSSSYNELLRCYVHNNSECGAQFLNSPENILFENQFENNTWNLGVDGDEMLDYYQNIDSSNKINNKPVYYLIEESELLLNESSPLGYLALVSCSNIIIKNLNFTNNYQGILLADTANVIVVNCSIYNNFHGVWLYSSAKTVIANTRISGNFYGVSTTKSIGTKVYYCDILNNTNYGIYSYNAESEYSINASYNWWGSAQGPGNETHPIVGSDKISANVIFKPWLIEYFELSPLVIERTKPENATVNVAPDTTITIVFSKIIDFSTIPNNISITELEIKNYSLDNDDRTIVLELSANLESYRRYTVTLNTDIKDRFGNCLSSYYQFWFRAKDITAPVIEIISPLNNTITKSNVTIV
ncbi:MAG: right-handed parallel beta-helix repeat-containing protein, partial [Candidatus Thermoplasmatota archaeon]